MAQRVLVTAGGSGIGREIARAFVDSGAKVCVCDIDEAALEAAAKDIPGLITKVWDVSKREDIEPMVADSVDSLGGLDVLVNNAGISGPTAPVAEMDPDAWEKVMQVNLTGTFSGKDPRSDAERPTAVCPGYLERLRRPGDAPRGVSTLGDQRRW